MVEPSAALAGAADRLIDDAVAALEHRQHPHYQASTAEDRRRYLQDLFTLVVECVHHRNVEPIIEASERIALDRFVAGFDIAEVQGAFNVLEEVLWRGATELLAGEARVETYGLVNTIVGAGRDALARTYVALARRDTAASVDGAGSSGADEAGTRTGGAAVRTEVVGRVGIITLDDPRRRNALSARLTNGIIDALGRVRAEQARAVVLRAASGMSVWSAGHDIDELPRGRRDPLAYDDPLEQLIRAIRTFPAPVVAMVHGSVWGGAFDLVLSCDVVVADETATFAITPANLGLPYNTTGLLHFLGRVPVNLIKEMFFTAAPIDANQAKAWMVINHLVGSADLDAFTLALGTTMAAKAPLAMAVIKEQLRVLTDYTPVAAQVYERIQGLRRQAYDSDDYLEGLNAFTERRPPIFRGI